MRDFEVIIGLEVHVQMNTGTKLWCRCSNDDFDLEPNTAVCSVCMGFPGELPVLNEKAVEKGIQTALALQCDVQEMSSFDRKNYFYPDLPMGYQISQYAKPLALKGSVTLTVEGKQKTVGITRVHLENDAGKLMHEGDYSLVDFNRSGSPLMEIVTDPDLEVLWRRDYLRKSCKESFALWTLRKRTCTRGRCALTPLFPCARLARKNFSRERKLRISTLSARSNQR